MARYLFSWILRKLSCPWYLCCFDQQRWNLVNMRKHLNGLEHRCNFVSFLLCVSQSLVGTIQRKLACPCAGVDTHQSQVLCCTCSANLSVFFLSPLKGGISFCIVVASYGHVSLIVDQLGWQRCRSPLLHRSGVVVRSLVSRCET